MIPTPRFELPDRLEPKRKKAVRLEWLTLAYLGSVIIVMYLVLGSSQAMKTAWLEDVLSVIPAIAFLIATRIYTKPPTEHFPYGFHRVFSIAYLAGALALLAMGLFMVIDSAGALIRAEHPTVGTTQIFGYTIWHGWLMIVALLYSAVPAFFIGRAKQPLAIDLHNKILFTDADAQKADYRTALAAILGIVGIGFGLWWADAAAALFISFSVLWDGVTNLRDGVTDLMDRYPKKVEKNEYDELVQEVADKVRALEWVRDVRVRMQRERAGVLRRDLRSAGGRHRPRGKN